MTTTHDPLREALAEECKRLAEKLNVRYLDLCQRHTEETLHDFNVFRGALHAAIDRLATPAVSRAEGLEPSKLRRDQIVDLISSVSNNSADHDIAFAYRVLDAASAVAPAAPAEPSEPDVADIIAGALQCSRAYAYTLIERAIAGRWTEPRAGASADPYGY